MCSFMVSTDKKINLEEFKKGFEKIKYRGPDQTRILECEGIFGFHRLSIMGLTESGMQPFVLKNNVVVCNGEIYNFRFLKKQLITERENRYEKGNSNNMSCGGGNNACRLLG